ncbi:hypothetical protein, partial [Phocaeicola vulgatus]|uniref:hypothetical protein n=1 Tax=Phocaeicola vulgatus TaxID=821 RepID=UPI0034A587B6
NNAAYLPESPIVYIILPKSIRNRASFTIFVLISVNFKICFSYVTKISGGNDTINGIFLFVKESFPICNRKIPMVRRGE